jgi:hypothetical protein
MKRNEVEEMEWKLIERSLFLFVETNNIWLLKLTHLVSIY